MTSTFPRTRRSRNGYNISEVEGFLEDARRAYTDEVAAPASITAEGIRRVAFSFEKGGYSPEHVDAALERLEDAFATRENERLEREQGADAVLAQRRRLAQEVLDRVTRPTGNRFARVSLLSSGYRRSQVDELADRVARFLRDGTGLTAQDVRTAAFRPQRGGYSEAQVDVVLDSVIELIHAA